MTFKCQFKSIYASLYVDRASLIVQLVKNLPAMQETQVQFLVWEDLLEKEMATHSSILAWETHGQRSLAYYSLQGHKSRIRPSNSAHMYQLNDFRVVRFLGLIGKADKVFIKLLKFYISKSHTKEGRDEGMGRGGEKEIPPNSQSDMTYRRFLTSTRTVSRDGLKYGGEYQHLGQEADNRGRGQPVSTVNYDI